MRRLTPLVFLACALASWAVPSIASASPGLQIAHDPPKVRKERRPPPADRERKGFLVNAAASPGAVVTTRGFTPVMRVGYQLGGGLTDKFTLGIDITGTFNLAEKGAAFGGDVVLTGFPRGGFLLRTGVGANSSLATGDDRPALFDPGIGGFAGLGYEFALGKKGALALTADYDVRALTSGAVRQTVFVGVRFGAYIGKLKKR